MASSTVERQARQIVQALGGVWIAGNGIARCPAHLDRKPSLSITGKGGKVLVHCHAGCTQGAVIRALIALGLWYRGHASIGELTYQPQASSMNQSGRELAERIWCEGGEVDGSLAENYLRSRAITIGIPASLRYVRDCFCPGHGRLPAVIAGVQNPDGIVTAIQRVYLKPDGRGKASDVSEPKLSLGLMANGAVRLGRPSEVLGLCEGWETGLAAQQLYGIPVWASLSAARMHRVWLPEKIHRVVIFADKDPAGLNAAELTAKVHRRIRRSVEIRVPLIGKDFNDELMCGVTI